MKRGRGGGRGAKSGAGRAPLAKKRKAGEADDSQQDNEDDMETTTGLTFAGTAQCITTLLFIYSFIERINCLIFHFFILQTREKRPGSVRSSTRSTKTSRRTSSASLSERYRSKLQF
jgi:hypothetical protein